MIKAARYRLTKLGKYGPFLLSARGINRCILSYFVDKIYLKSKKFPFLDIDIQKKMRYNIRVI